MNVRLELNDDSAADRLKEAATKKVDAGAGETLGEAFSRILAMKNAEADVRKIQAVRRALESGEITRESEPVAKGKKLTKAEVLRLYKAVEKAEQERVLQQMKAEMPDNYVLVDDVETFEAMCDQLNHEDVIPIDVETAGTDIWSDYIVGYVVSNVGIDYHYYIPTKHKTDEKQLDHDYVTDGLRGTFEHKNVLYIGHNIK